MKRIDDSRRGAAVAILWFGVLAALAVDGSRAGTAVGQEQSVVDMAGMRMTVGSLVGFTAGGQLVSGINRSSAGSMVNQAGFLATMSLQPNLDSDGDGVCNELSVDNDKDGIEDLAELLGTSFSPAAPTDPDNADSDGDKMGDGDEAVAGTSPMVAGSILEMTGIEFVGGGLRVTWKGGSSARQILMRAAALGKPDTDWVPIYTNEPPTLTTMALLDMSGTNSMYYYRIKAERP